MDDQQPSGNKPVTVSQAPPSGAPAPVPAAKPGVAPQTEFVNHWQTNGGTQPEVRKPRRRWILVILAAVLLVLSLIIGLSVNRHKQLPIKANNSANIVKPPPKPASSDTPLGQTATGSSDTANLSIKVTDVIYNPNVTGDKPDTGEKYLEIDLSVTNSGGNSAIVPGTFVYQTADGSLVNTADSTAQRSGSSAKNVQVAGKQSVEDLSLNSRQTAGPVYLIYQVPQADKYGKLIWYDGYYDTGSTKLAIFDLN